MHPEARAKMVGIMYSKVYSGHNLIKQFLFLELTPVQEETATPQEGLTRVDIIAIILGLALTAFLVVSILLLLYRAEKRRKETKYVDRWQVDIQTNVSRDLTKNQKRKTNDTFRNWEMEYLTLQRARQKFYLV